MLTENAILFKRGFSAKKQQKQSRKKPRKPELEMCEKMRFAKSGIQWSTLHLMCSLGCGAVRDDSRNAINAISPATVIVNGIVAIVAVDVAQMAGIASSTLYCDK